ncbi:hypothetical protein L9F63_017908, partial [Diploptera punctata]
TLTSGITSAWTIKSDCHSETESPQESPQWPNVTTVINKPGLSRAIAIQRLNHLRDCSTHLLQQLCCPHLD